MPRDFRSWCKIMAAGACEYCRQPCRITKPSRDSSRWPQKSASRTSVCLGAAIGNKGRGRPVHTGRPLPVSSESLLEEILQTELDRAFRHSRVSEQFVIRERGIFEAREKELVHGYAEVRPVEHVVYFGPEFERVPLVEPEGLVKGQIDRRHSRRAEVIPARREQVSEVGIAHAFGEVAVEVQVAAEEQAVRLSRLELADARHLPPAQNVILFP